MHRNHDRPRSLDRMRGQVARTMIALGAAATLALTGASGASAGMDAGSAAAQTVNGTVGPGFTISLTLGGKKVTKLKPTTYKFKITDNSSIHNFHLSGPAYNKAITSVGFKGTKSVRITLRKGTYRYVCDLHPSIMKGSFKVG
jgi:plastocyanin